MTTVTTTMINSVHTKRDKRATPAQEMSSVAADPAENKTGPRRIQRHGALFYRAAMPLGLLLLVLAAGEWIPYDLWVQDCLFDWNSRQWLLEFDKHSALGLTFYVMPKILLGIFAGALLLLSIRQQWGRFTCPWNRPRLVYVLLCLALIPSLVAVLKAHTGVAYPRKIDRYNGGRIPYRTVWQSIPHQSGEKRYKGWPAGHASGGYALFGLAYAALSRSGRRRGLLIALTAGSLMGTYQMLTGNHYLSHTIVSLLLAWLVAGLLATSFRLENIRA